MAKTTRTKSKHTGKKYSTASPLKSIRGSILLNKKVLVVFVVLFGIIGSAFIVFSGASADPKLATTFWADSPYFQRPAPGSNLSTENGTTQILGNSVNQTYPQLLWVGPGATFNYHKNGNNVIQACWRVRDNGRYIFGKYNDAVAANVTFSITADGGKTVLASESPTLNYLYADTTVYGFYPYCIQTNQLTDGKTYNNVEYRVVINKGGLSIQNLDLHGIDFTYAPPPPTPAPTTNTPNGGSSDSTTPKTGDNNQQVSCSALGCPNNPPAADSNTKTTGTRAASNPILSFSAAPATKYDPGDVTAVVNYIAAVECSKQPLMHWNDSTKKCEPDDYSFVPVLLAQQNATNYRTNLQEQASGGGTGGGCTSNCGLVDLSFLNGVAGLVCAVGGCSGSSGSVPTTQLYSCKSQRTDSKSRRVYSCLDKYWWGHTKTGYDCSKIPNSDQEAYTCFTR